MRVVAFEDLTVEDLRFLVEGAHALWAGVTAEKILFEIASGKGFLLRIVGKGRGIITGQIFDYPLGKEFVMGVFAGNGIFPNEYAPLSDSVFEWAKGKGCRWVRFENLHPILDRFYSRKFVRKATVFVKEI